MSKELVNNVDYYIEGERVIFTALAHIKRGQCCGNGCKNCAYEPKYEKGNVVLAKEFIKFTPNNFENGTK